MYKPNLLRSVLFVVLSSTFLTGCVRFPFSMQEGGSSKPPTVPSGRIDHRKFEDVEIGSTPLNWNTEEIDRFSGEINRLFERRDFAGLDRLAGDLRSTKARFEYGGGWKIHTFYMIVSAPSTATEWDAHIAILGEWKTATGSITAKTALAKAIMNTAWEMRGTGYADEVDPAVWPAFNERVKQATNVLNEAAIMSERCHGYYETVLEFFREVGTDGERAEKAYQEAVAFDKDYQYFYIEKAYNLMPRWGGAPGELASFAESLITDLGEPDGLITYFLIAADVHALEHDQFFAETGLSWRKTKKGFLLFEAKYRPTSLRVNQLAAMAWSAKDPQAACNAHKRLTGPKDFNSTVWKSREDFETRHRFVLDAMCKMPRSENQAL